jgi:indole-3-acetate monooxygenase
MPAEHWEIRDTWHALGLKGTGSHHVALTDVLVPDSNFFEFPFGTSFAPDPIFGKYAEIVVLSHGALAVGIAEGAIMDLVELAGTRVKQMFMTTPLAETERFKEGLARLDADLMAARAARGADHPRLAKSGASGREGPDPRCGTTASGSLDHRGLRPRRRRLL